MKSIIHDAAGVAEALAKLRGEPLKARNPDCIFEIDEDYPTVYSLGGKGPPSPVIPDEDDGA